MSYRCSGCGAEIIWSTTTNGKAVPLDAKPERRFVLKTMADGTTIADLQNVFVSHFATCVKANMFRKKDNE